jgi:hypothetical protein
MAGSPGYYVYEPYKQEPIVFFMADEPPDGQYRLDNGEWVPLPDGWFISDMLMDGDPALNGPVAEAPAGAPAPPEAAPPAAPAAPA